MQILRTTAAKKNHLSCVLENYCPQALRIQFSIQTLMIDSNLASKMTSLLKNGNEERAEMLNRFGDEFSLDIEQSLQQFLKEKFHEWLLQQLTVGGNGLRVLDEGGQGVLHIGAALGYDWVLSPMKMAGVGIDFREGNGWTALDWTAFCGRGRAVALLIGLGAAPGALTDPCTKNPTGKTPAELASEKGYMGIAGYVAESSLSAHLSSLKLDKSVQPVPEQISASSNDGDLTDGPSMSVCLTALCNAAQAAALIQLFNVQSFHWKQWKEYGEKFKTSDEGALSLSAIKSHKKCDEHVNSAELQIPDKCRKDRKEILRSRTLQIQAYVRDTVRTNCRNIVRAAGILEKIILRWRRKGTGLRGNLAWEDVLAHMNELTAAAKKTISRNCSQQVQSQCQQTSQTMDRSLHYNVTTKVHEGVHDTDLLKSLGPLLMDSDEQNGLQVHLPNADCIEGIAGHCMFDWCPEKLDRLDRWARNEFDRLDEPQMLVWDTVGSKMEVDGSIFQGEVQQ